MDQTFNQLRTFWNDPRTSYKELTGLLIVGNAFRYRSAFAEYSLRMSYRFHASYSPIEQHGLWHQKYVHHSFTNYYFGCIVDDVATYIFKYYEEETSCHEMTCVKLCWLHIQYLVCCVKAALHGKIFNIKCMLIHWFVVFLADTVVTPQW